jgi:large subunit ribosomal protein L29
MTKVGELRDLGDEDLFERLESSKEELFNLRFQLATGQLDNPMRIKDLRHDVARILTVLRERELESLAEAEAELRAERRAELEARRAPVAAGAATDDGATDEDDQGSEAPATTEGTGTRRRRLRRTKPAEGQEDQ